MTFYVNLLIAWFFVNGAWWPPERIGANKHAVDDKPDRKKDSTSYVERNKGIIRKNCKRYARLTQAFSKKIENHVYAFALRTTYHNFVKIHGTHRMTPRKPLAWTPDSGKFPIWSR